MENLTIDGKEYQASNIKTNKANILLIQGAKGFLGCGYFSIEAANRLGEAVAIVTGVKTYDDMLNAQVIKLSDEAQKLGINEGQSGRDALLLLG